MPPKARAKAKGKAKAAAQEVKVDPFLKELQEKSVDELLEIEKEWKENAAKEKRNRMLAMYDRVCDSLVLLYDYLSYYVYM